MTDKLPRHRRHGRSAAGFIMIEVLVALALVLIGILGLVGLQSRAHQGEMEAYQRTQALVFMRDMVDRIETHRQAARCFGQITTSLGTPFVGTSGTVPASCAATGVPATDDAALAAITAWSDLLAGAGEQVDAANVGAMIDAIGCVAVDVGPDAVTPDTYTVAVAWQGLSDFPVATPAADASTGEKNAAACGTGLFGGEARRRVVWTTLSLAKLR
jgi:type IV pilus assembly protein PilV